jgi:hypothetical protein
MLQMSDDSQSSSKIKTEPSWYTLETIISSVTNYWGVVIESNPSPRGRKADLQTTSDIDTKPLEMLCIIVT